ARVEEFGRDSLCASGRAAAHRRVTSAAVVGRRRDGVCGRGGVAEETGWKEIRRRPCDGRSMALERRERDQRAEANRDARSRLQSADGLARSERPLGVAGHQCEGAGEAGTAWRTSALAGWSSLPERRDVRTLVYRSVQSQSGDWSTRAGSE